MSENNVGVAETLINPIAMSWITLAEKGVFFISGSDADNNKNLFIQNTKISAAFDDGDRAVLKVFLTAADAERYALMISKKFNINPKFLEVSGTTFDNFLNIIESVNKQVEKQMDPKGTRVDFCTFLKLPNQVHGLITLDVLCGGDNKFSN